MKCIVTGCDNQARYASPGEAWATLCGLCDLDVNGGKGTKALVHCCALCRKLLDDSKRWWQGVPGTGDVCDDCHQEIGIPND
jgi:hypothetical protein